MKDLSTVIPGAARGFVNCKGQPYSKSADLAGKLGDFFLSAYKKNEFEILSSHYPWT